jgi:hypothetical protein
MALDCGRVKIGAGSLPYIHSLTEGMLLQNLAILAQVLACSGQMNMATLS